MVYIGEEFQKRFKTLPEDIQNALTAVASVDTIFAIGKKHGLMVDQIGKMADEIWKVMLGLANPKDFIRNLASALGIDPAQALAIAGDVNAEMFQLVRESLRKIYDSARQPPQTPPYQGGGIRGGVSPSSLRDPTESEERGNLDKIATSPRSGAAPRDDETKELKAAPIPSIPSMIYPQDRFEEPFEGDPTRMSDLEGRTKEELGEARELGIKNKELMVSQSPPSTPPLPKKEEFTYPEKTKGVSREPASPAGGPAAGQGGYKSRDPYRESVE